MKKAVVTILGMIGHTKPENTIENDIIKKSFIDKNEQDMAIYTFNESLQESFDVFDEKRYLNTLPLLIDTFEDREIIPVATEQSLNVQKEVLKFLNRDLSVLDKSIMIDDTSYEKIFKQISDILNDSQYESFIIDLTHGFRHLPILMLINLIIASFEDIDKIEHILFAKEIEKNTKYVIIDLIDYVGLAKLAFVLENFNTNYTVGNKLVFKNLQYQDLVDNLRIVSGHILANSIKKLIDGKSNLIKETIEKLNALKDSDSKISSFDKSIDLIIEHLENIVSLNKEEDFMKLFQLSKMMSKRGYLLNAITLLNESIGLYCAKLISDLSDEFKGHIEKFIVNDESKLYELAHQSKSMFKQLDDFKGVYLYDPHKVKLTAGQKTALQKKRQKLKEKIDPKIMDEIKAQGFIVELKKENSSNTNSIKKKIIRELKKQDNDILVDIIKEAEKLRNNLAHGNSSEKIKNVPLLVNDLIKRFNELIVS
jgi:CRISPR-associated DxTHG motif protein